MSSIHCRLGQIKSHLQQFVPDQVIFELCKQCKHRWRDRKLNPVTTIHLLLLQLLAQVALQGLRHVAQVKVSAQAICKARKRLPLKVFAGLVEYSCQLMSQRLKQPCSSLYKGLRLVLVDGTSFLTPDTPQLAKHHGRHRNQRGTSNSYPVGKLLALMDWSSGLLQQVIQVPRGLGERSVLSQMFKHLQAGDLLMGDRGLISFAHAALLLEQKLNCLMRLPRWLLCNAQGRPHGRRLKRLGKQDWLVSWRADRRPKWMSKQQWKQLPQQVQLRQIGYRICRKGFRTQWAWLVTTLTDAKLYPAQELIELYQKRWQVEVNFCAMKKTLGLKKLSAESPEGISKEILGLVLLYNLTRQVMQEAAQQQCEPADRISFQDALNWLLWSEPGAELPKLVVNKKRERPTEPRRLKRVSRRYPQLKGSRAKQRLPRHEVRI